MAKDCEEGCTIETRLTEKFEAMHGDIRVLVERSEVGSKRLDAHAADIDKHTAQISRIKGILTTVTTFFSLVWAAMVAYLFKGGR